MTTAVLLLPRPLDHQIPILTHPARFKVICCGRRWGKTMLGLIAALDGHGPALGGQRRWRGAARGAQVWWVAPTFGMAEDIWRTVKRATERVAVEKSEQQRRMVLPGGGSLTIKSADNPDSLRGVGLDGLVLDEAAFVLDPTAWPSALRPALSDRQGWAILPSTPNGENWFKDLFDRAGDQADWRRWQQPTESNPLISAGELDAARHEIGERAYRQEYGAEFVGSATAVFVRDWVRRWATPPAGVPYVVGVDMAHTSAQLLPSRRKADPDYTACVVLGVRRPTELAVVDVRRGRWDLGERRQVLLELHEQYEAPVFAVEDTTNSKDALQELYQHTHLRLRAVRPDRDKVSRALPVAAAMQRGELWLPRSAEWLGEFERELFGFPTAPHDDQVDAFGCAWRVATTESLELAGSGVTVVSSI